MSSARLSGLASTRGSSSRAGASRRRSAWRTALVRQGHVRAPRVAQVAAPFGLAVADENDFHLAHAYILVPAGYHPGCRTGRDPSPQGRCRVLQPGWLRPVSRSIHSGHRPLHPPALGSPPRGRCRDRRDRRGRHGGRRDQHPRRQRHADHVPGPARVRLLAGHGERVEHDRPRPRARSAGAVGYRRELAGQRTRVLRFGAGVAARRDHRRGAAARAAAVGVRGDRAGVHRHRAACRSCSSRGSTASWPSTVRAPEAHGTGFPRVLVYLAGVYGGYFGAAQGILLLAILGLALPDDLQRVNALKNVLAGTRERAWPRSSSSRSRTWPGGRPR